jgi:hypothetical protein
MMPLVKNPMLPQGAPPEEKAILANHPRSSEPPIPAFSPETKRGKYSDRLRPRLLTGKLIGKPDSSAISCSDLSSL